MLESSNCRTNTHYTRPTPLTMAGTGVAFALPNPLPLFRPESNIRALPTSHTLEGTHPSQLYRGDLQNRSQTVEHQPRSQQNLYFPVSPHLVSLKAKCEHPAESP